MMTREPEEPRQRVHLGCKWQGEMGLSKGVHWEGAAPPENQRPSPLPLEFTPGEGRQPVHRCQEQGSRGPGWVPCHSATPVPKGPRVGPLPLLFLGQA